MTIGSLNRTIHAVFAHSEPVGETTVVSLSVPVLAAIERGVYRIDVSRY